jgi:hypothetical protein
MVDNANASNEMGTLELKEQQPPLFMARLQTT